MAGHAGSRGPALSGVRAFVLRLLPNGQPDATFGSGGGFVLPSAIPSFYDSFTSVTPLADGRLVVGGIGGPVPDSGFATRLTVNGAVDRSFGSNGFVAFHTHSNVFVDALGRIVAAVGHEAKRWTANGAPDPTFGQGGRVDIPYVGSAGKKAVARPGGGILLLGGDDTGLLTMVLANDGSLDRTYGGGTGTRLASFEGRLDGPTTSR